MLIFNPQNHSLRIVEERVCPECGKEFEAFSFHCIGCHENYCMLEDGHCCKEKDEPKRAV